MLLIVFFFLFAKIFKVKIRLISLLVFTGFSNATNILKVRILIALQNCALNFLLIFQNLMIKENTSFPEAHFMNIIMICLHQSASEDLGKNRFIAKKI